VRLLGGLCLCVCVFGCWLLVVGCCWLLSLNRNAKQKQWDGIESFTCFNSSSLSSTVYMHHGIIIIINVFASVFLWDSHSYSNWVHCIKSFFLSFTSTFVVNTSYLLSSGTMYWDKKRVYKITIGDSVWVWAFYDISILCIPSRTASRPWIEHGSPPKQTKQQRYKGLTTTHQHRTHHHSITTLSASNWILVVSLSTFLAYTLTMAKAPIW